MKLRAAPTVSVLLARSPRMDWPTWRAESITRTSWLPCNFAQKSGMPDMHGVMVTVSCMFFGLVPIMWSAGAGADVMKRIAAPMIGGFLTSFILELVVYPPIFAIWKWDGKVKPELKRAELLS